ncbi:C-C motif chemokine 5-like isoform X1 [Sturnira hondurensis]|uniref:C-C motif chemokine 5-like isoform X1 n=1 Tax=Sturnira hondurensis TaxID=192404 RepID=UPI00187A1989|nr:C-C motif chemokine 5-like isoform X1 [Sturnira hondurensis]
MTSLPSQAWPSETQVWGSLKVPDPQGDHKAAEEQDTEVANLDVPRFPRMRVLRCMRVRRPLGLGAESAGRKEAECPELGTCLQATPELEIQVGSDTPTACCFSYASRQVPRRLIANYFETSSQCSKAGIIFLTKRSRQVCADPREAWVQEYVMDLELNARVARKL